MYKPNFIAAIFLATLLVTGCSMPGVAPDELLNNSVRGIDNGITSTHSLWGMWDICIDTSNLAAAIEPMRNTSTHFNVTSMLVPPACNDCLEVEVNSYDPVSQILDMDVTLKNPTHIVGHDIRGILFTNDVGHSLLNPDAWTDLYDVPGGMPYNPFKAFAKAAPMRAFAGMTKQTEKYIIHVPKPPQYWAIQYAVDASWPGNCREPYTIENFSQGELFASPGSSTSIKADVRDWQNDVSQVIISAPGITGEADTYLSLISGSTWGGKLTNALGASEGDYAVFIRAYSTDSPVLPLYQAVPLKIGEAGGGWARTWGGDDIDMAYSPGHDSSGNIYVTGQYSGTVDFDPGPGVDEHTTDLYNRNAFIAKYDSNGQFIWARTWGSEYGDCCGRTVTADSNDCLYVCGDFNDDTDFDPGPGVDMRSSLGSSTFLSKFDSSGNYQWVRTWQGCDNGWFRPAAAAGGTDIYVVASFDSTTDFDPGSGVDNHSPVGNIDVCLSKFDSNGNFMWCRTWGGKWGDYGFWVAADTTGNVFVVGCFSSTVDFDPGPGVDNHTGVGNGDDCFLSKFDSSGNFQWAGTWGGAQEDECSGVIIKGADAVYVTGNFSDDADFDPGPGVDIHYQSGFSHDDFLSKFDLSGNFQWARTWESGDVELDCRASVANSGDVYVVGSFMGQADLDPGPGVDNHKAKGYGDVYLSKFSSDGAYQWGRNWGGESSFENTAGGVTTFGTSVYFSGSYDASCDFNPSTEEDIHTTNGGDDCFLVKLRPTGYW